MHRRTRTSQSLVIFFSAIYCKSVSYSPVSENYNLASTRLITSYMAYIQWKKTTRPPGWLDLIHPCLYSKEQRRGRRISKKPQEEGGEPAL